MHLAINSGTDLALFNAWFTYIGEKGWIDKDFIAASTKDFDKAVAANKTSARGRGQDHRPYGRSDQQVGGVDRQAEGWRRRTPHHVRLREGSDLGQRQLPHQWRSGERRAGHRQCRPARLRLRSHGRSSGRLCAALGRACRKAGGLRRQAAAGGQGRRPSHLGVRPLQDDAERATSSNKTTRSGPT